MVISQEQNKNIESIEKSIFDLAQKNNISFNDALTLIKKKHEQSLSLPASIFNNNSLSALEAIVKYMKENLSLNYAKIALLLNRNYDPIRITYSNSRLKMKSTLNISVGETIPISIFKNQNLSVLENIAFHLKKKMTFHEIALLLNRDDRTIWTVCKRALKKQEAGKTA
jgi:hypothetical protein